MAILARVWKDGQEIVINQIICRARSEVYTALLGRFEKICFFLFFWGSQFETEAQKMYMCQLLAFYFSKI
jgi:hypothetical protein